MLNKNREFNWISSVTGSPEALEDLDKKLNRYYSEWETRQKYQGQINNPDHHQPLVERGLVQAVLQNSPGKILEVGCGSGRLYQALKSAGFKGEYFGLEMSQQVIEANREKFRDANWICGSVYSATVPNFPFDSIYAYFVLEHCIFPERALRQMCDWLRPGGSLVLVFPDYVTSRLFSSQHIGHKEGRAKNHLAKGDFLNAVITLYDSRVRLPRAIRNAKEEIGAFPINLNPRCLIKNCAEIPDTDAVYLSSKSEVHEWASAQGYKVTYPQGVEGLFRDNALIQITK